MSKRHVLASSLRQCKSLLDGKHLHSVIHEAGLEDDGYLGNLLIRMYSSCGSLEDARTVFDGLHCPNIYSWNLIIAAYAQHGFLDEAMVLLEQSPERDTVTWNSMVAAYTQKGSVFKARSLFDKMPKRDMISWNTLLNGYVKSESLEIAKIMFERIPHWNTVSSNIILAAYAQEGHLHDAMDVFNVMPQRSVVSWNALMATTLQQAEVAMQVFERMPQHSCVSWNSIVTTYACSGRPEEAKRLLLASPERDIVAWTAVISAYSENGHFQDAKALFDTMLYGKDIVVWNCLLSGYNQVEDARSLFSKMPKWDVVSWTSLMCGYSRGGNVIEAVELFQKMPERSIVSWNALLSAVPTLHARTLFQKMPLHNTVSWNLIVTVNAQAGHLDEAKLMFNTMPLKTAASQTAMLVAYADAGQLAKAKEIFDVIPQKDAMCWNSMISAQARHGLGEESLRTFCRMEMEGMQPDKVTYLGILDACASLSAINEGKMIHEKLLQVACHNDLAVKNALVNMYGRCGVLDDARTIFEDMCCKDVVSWTAMITSYARNGYGKEAFHVFVTMLLGGLEPNEVTFISILSACSHAGLVEDACDYFISLQENFGIHPGPQHFACLIDALARTGQIEMAESLLKEVSLNNQITAGKHVAWNILLGACRMHGDHVRAAAAAYEVVDKDTTESCAAYILMSDVYASEALAKYTHQKFGVYKSP